MRSLTPTLPLKKHVGSRASKPTTNCAPPEGAASASWSPVAQLGSVTPIARAMARAARNASPAHSCACAGSLAVSVSTRRFIRLQVAEAVRVVRYLIAGHAATALRRRLALCGARQTLHRLRNLSHEAR